jgi:RecG-like helicase
LPDITTQVQAIDSATNNASAQFTTTIAKLKSEIKTATATNLNDLQNSLQTSLELIASSEVAAFLKVADVVSLLRLYGKTVDPQILNVFTDLATLAKTNLRAAINNLNDKIQVEIAAKQQVSLADVVKLMSLRNSLAQSIQTDANELAAEANGASDGAKNAIKIRLQSINNFINADQELSIALNNKFDLFINPQIALDNTIKNKIEALLLNLH